eukprot:3546666-Alexandrium_andersonii.AAC.1
MINRLSTAPAPPQAGGSVGDPIPELSSRARALLRAAVSCPVSDVRSKAAADAQAARQLKRFLGHSGVLRANVWLEEFGRLPPRGT